MDSKDSRYAYAHFSKGIDEVETINGELVQLNYPIFEGETNLMSAEQFRVLQQNFSDRISGEIIKQENLINMINLLYEQLKKDIETLPEIDDYTKSRFEYLKRFEVNNALKPDNATESSINDLANKFFILQEQVRKVQREISNKNKHHR